MRADPGLPGSDTEIAFAVDLDHLEEVTGDLAHCDQEFAALLGELERVVAGLHAHWTGQAADGHALAQRQWQAGFAMMRVALRGLRDDTRACRTSYADAAAANLRIWGS